MKRNNKRRKPVNVKRKKKGTLEHNSLKKVVLPLAVVVVFVALGIGFTSVVFSATGNMGKIKQIVTAGNPTIGFDSATMVSDKVEGVVDGFTRPKVDSCYGKITANNINLRASLYYGDSSDSFERGAGQYIESGFPGEGKTILVGAHDTTYFAPLENIEKGEQITVNTGYGKFTYQVTGTKVGKVTNEKLWRLKSDKEQLVMYTCYPFGDLFDKGDKRFYVYAEKVQGPTIAEEDIR